MHRYYIPCVVASSSHLRCVLLRTARQYYYLFSNSRLSPLTPKLTACALFHATADSNTRQAAYITLNYSTHERLMTGYRQVWSIIQSSVVFGIFQRYHNNFDSTSLARIWSWASAYGEIFSWHPHHYLCRYGIWCPRRATSVPWSFPVINQHISYCAYRTPSRRLQAHSLPAYPAISRISCCFFDWFSTLMCYSIHRPNLLLTYRLVVSSIFLLFRSVCYLLYLLQLTHPVSNAPINDRDISIQWRSNC